MMTVSHSQKDIGKKLRKYRWMYLMMLPGLACIFIFSYIPMYGIVIAFKDYKMGLGIMDSQWIGALNFMKLFTGNSFPKVLRNTLLISMYRLLLGFPAPIVMAILLNEIYSIRFKKVVQTISYLPYFLSWVVLGGVVILMFSTQLGPINNLLILLGKNPIQFMTSPVWIVIIIVFTGVWQGVGWNSIIYLASIAGINPELYEAARIDGANRFDAAWYITIPSLAPVITILFILNVGGILNAGFDQIFNLYNTLVYSTTDILDTYIYRRGLIDFDMGYATAAGLFKNGVGLILILLVNFITKRINEYGIW